MSHTAQRAVCPQDSCDNIIAPPILAGSLAATILTLFGACGAQIFRPLNSLNLIENACGVSKRKLSLGRGLVCRGRRAVDEGVWREASTVADAELGSPTRVPLVSGKQQSASRENAEVARA